MAASVPSQSKPGQGQRLSNLYSFISAGRTGTGSQETIKHLLGRRPDFIVVTLDDTSGGTNTYVLGVSDKDNILITVTNTATYSVAAFII